MTRPGLLARRSLGIILVCLLLFAAVFAAAVHTAAGPRFEDAVRSGAHRVGGPGFWAARHTLGVAARATLAAGLLAVTAAGLLRRRVSVTIAAVALVLGSAGTAVALNRYVLSRPELAVAHSKAADGFPSWHAAFAMALVFAALLVLPAHSHVPAAVTVLPVTACFDALAVTTGWDRVGDVVAGTVVALGVAAAVVAVLAWTGRTELAPPRGWALPRVGAGLLTLGGLAALAAAVGYGLLYHRHQGSPPVAVKTAAWQAFLAGQALAAAVSTAAALAMLALVRATDFVAPALRRPVRIPLRALGSRG